MYIFQYAIVIDAASSHSQALLYTWKLPYYNETAQVYELDSCETESIIMFISIIYSVTLLGGGIDSYASDPSQAGPSLYDCTHSLLTEVPEDVYNAEPNINVWVGATAGMRLLK